MKRFFFCLILLCCSANLLFSQSGNLRGTVTDKETGDLLPGANIIIAEFNFTTTTDLQGDYILLGIPPGEYSVRVEYNGYKKTTYSNIRIHATLTTRHDFKLAPAGAQIESVQIAAETPVLLENTTNTFRFHSQEDIQNLPVRGLQKIIALNAGTVMQDGKFHIRGGRSGEIKYLIDGATATNPLFNGLNTVTIQEAIAEIHMQTGGFSAEFGGANSTVVNTILRTGGSSLSGTIDYRTDDFVSGGDNFLATTSRGYRNLVATLGGPVPFMPKMKFFLAGQYNYARNRSAVFIEPFTFDPLDDSLPLWSRELWNNGQREFYTPWFVEDGLWGRADSVNTPFTNAAGEVVPFKFDRNSLPNNDTRSFTTNGTLVYNMNDFFRFRLTGSYDYTRQPQGWNNFYQATINYYSNKIINNEWKRSFLNLRATHKINPTTFYELGIFWSSRKFKNYDPRFGDDWQKYSDAREWGKAGLDTSSWQRVFIGPLNYSTVFDFGFSAPNTPVSGYTKSSQNNFGISLDFTRQLTKNLEIKLGGVLDSWTLRSWSIRPNSYMRYMYGEDAALWDPSLPNNGGRTWADDPVYGSSEYRTTLELDRRAGIDYYGWDIMGENKINDGPYGPRKPLFFSSYLQTKWQHKNLNINLGLRWEHFDYNALRPEFPELPEYDAANEWIDVDALVYTKPFNYFLPRLNLAFLLTEKTVFYAQYGKYAQSVMLNNVYQSFSSLSSLIPENRNVLGTSVNYLQKPERNDQYELGARFSLFDNFAVTTTAFYKNMYDLVRAGELYADGHIPEGEQGLPIGTQYDGAYLNEDIAVARGLEFTADLRRSKRLTARINYTLSKVRGSGSEYNTNNVVLSDVTIARFPAYLYPLNYNQTHRGSLMFDYRFSRGDGGKIFQGAGLNLLMTFNSGPAYTKIGEESGIGCIAIWSVGTRSLSDNRFRRPAEPVNSSQMPWNFNIDMNFDKMFYFNRFNVKLYSNVLNLLNTKNIIHVFHSTGTPDDDSWLKSPLAKQYIAIPGFEPIYRTLNLVNGYAYIGATGNNLLGPPRQIRFGLLLEFK